MAHENAIRLAKAIARTIDMHVLPEDPLIDVVSRVGCEDNEVAIEMADGSVYSVQVLEVRGPRKPR